jgi:hypothetical protein
MIIQLAPCYELHKVTAEKFEPIFKEHVAVHFHEGRDSYFPLPLMSPEEQKRAAALRTNFKQNLYQCHYLLYKIESENKHSSASPGIKSNAFSEAAKGRELAGWTSGSQDSPESFCMHNSLVFPDHRNLGLYTKMTLQLLEELAEVGFLRVTSSHLASNNPILIAKLKLGFVIQGVEVHEKTGVVVNLCHHFKEHGKQAFEFRVGSRKKELLPPGVLT